MIWLMLYQNTVKLDQILAIWSQQQMIREALSHLFKKDHKYIYFTFPNMHIYLLSYTCI